LAQYGFTLFGILALGYCLGEYLNARFFQAKETRNFDMALHAKAGAAPKPAILIAPPAIPRAGSIVGRLEIPRLGVAVMVVEGVEDGDLKRAAGHIPGTALPGEPGNVGIAAHRDTFFRPLRSIRRDDTITLNTLQGAYCYRVVSTQVVPANDTQVLYPTGQDSLTLVTCFPFDWIGSAPKRFIVRAERTAGA
jgi:sortase A